MRSTEHARDKAPFAVPSMSIMDANTMTFSGTFSKSFNSEARRLYHLSAFANPSVLIETFLRFIFTISITIRIIPFFIYDVAN